MISEKVSTKLTSNQNRTRRQLFVYHYLPVNLLIRIKFAVKMCTFCVVLTKSALFLTVCEFWSCFRMLAVNFVSDCCFLLSLFSSWGSVDSKMTHSYTHTHIYIYLWISPKKSWTCCCFNGMWLPNPKMNVVDVQQTIFFF